MFGKVGWFIFLIVCALILVVFGANTRNYIVCKGLICETYESNSILKTIDNKGRYNVENYKKNYVNNNSNTFHIVINDVVIDSKRAGEHISCAPHSETTKSNGEKQKKTSYWLVPARFNNPQHNVLNNSNRINEYFFNVACEIDKTAIEKLLNSNKKEFTYVFWGNYLRFLWYILALGLALLGMYILIKGRILTETERNQEINSIPEEYKQAAQEKIEQLQNILDNIPNIDKNITDNISNFTEKFDINIDIHKHDK